MTTGSIRRTERPFDPDSLLRLRDQHPGWRLWYVLPVSGDGGGYVAQRLDPAGGDHGRLGPPDSLGPVPTEEEMDARLAYRTALARGVDEVLHRESDTERASISPVHDSLTAELAELLHRYHRRSV